jgi:hypothetical protein
MGGAIRTKFIKRPDKYPIFCYWGSSTLNLLSDKYQSFYSDGSSPGISKSDRCQWPNSTNKSMTNLNFIMIQSKIPKLSKCHHNLSAAETKLAPDPLHQVFKCVNTPHNPNFILTLCDVVHCWPRKTAFKFDNPVFVLCRSNPSYVHVE